MRCQPFRTAISARLDGEETGIPAVLLDEHLAACADCDGWSRAAARATRRARLAAAPAVPDLTAAVLGALPRELPGAAAVARAEVVGIALRLALLALGVAQAGLAWPVLVAGAGAMSAPTHLAHETVAWNVAVAVALLAVAARPRLALGALPFLGSLAALLVPVTLTDLGAGHVHADRAVAHLLVVAGALLVAVVAWRGRRAAVAAVGSRVTA
jgi:predicted anti-sigma-YlaC factor YlaD